MDGEAARAGYGRICVLGPIQCVATDGAVRRLTGQVATVAAWLVAHRRRPLDIGTFRPLLWPGPRDAPGDPERAARRLLRHAGAALMAVPDIVVDVDRTTVTTHAPPERIDADVFADAVRRARDDTQETTMCTLRAELDGWRGEPYPELVDRVGEVPELVQLAELRSEAELRLLARRVAGPTDPALVADVTAMTVEAPDDVRFRYLLAVAMYQAGGRAEALRLAHACRAVPSGDPERQARLVDDLEANILRGAPFAGDIGIVELR